MIFPKKSFFFALAVLVFSLHFAFADSHKEQWIDVGEFSAIEAEIGAADIEIKGAPNFGFRLKMGKKAAMPEVSVNSDGVLTVRHSETRRKNDSYKCEIEIFVPTELEKIEVKTASGDADLEEVSAKEIFVRTISGDIELKTVCCGKCAVESSSGDIEAEHFDFEEEASAKTLSGEIEFESVENLSGAEILAKSVAGKIKFNGAEVNPVNALLKSTQFSWSLLLAKLVCLPRHFLRRRSR